MLDGQNTADPALTRIGLNIDMQCEEASLANELSEVTRRAIVDFIVASETDWAGRLGEDDFLARLYDLTSIPSTDSRFENAAGDIWKHRIINFDWSSDWVFYDSRFNLLWAPDHDFLRFLCETVHPVVRPDSDAVRKLVAAYNSELAKDGWSLVEMKQISGKPVLKIGVREQFN